MTKYELAAMESGLLHRKITDLRAENTQLREALKEIAGHYDLVKQTKNGTALIFAAIAKAAIKRNPQDINSGIQ